jgi:hypothetical protein
MNKNLIIVGAVINSLICFSLAIFNIPIDRMVKPTPTVYKTKIILPTLIPTETPIPIPTINPFQGEIYQEDLFDFVFDYPEAQGLLLDQEHTDLITDDGTRMFYVRFMNPEMNVGEIDSLRYSIVYYQDISEAITKYDEAYNLLTTGGEYTLISETTILDGYPVSLFLKTDEEGGYELRFLTSTKNIYFDTTGSIIISASSDRESTIGAFMELMNSLHFQAVDELSLF